MATVLGAIQVGLCIAHTFIKTCTCSYTPTHTKIEQAYFDLSIASMPPSPSISPEEAAAHGGMMHDTQSTVQQDESHTHFSASPTRPPAREQPEPLQTPARVHPPNPAVHALAPQAHFGAPAQDGPQGGAAGPCGDTGMAKSILTNV